MFRGFQDASVDEKFRLKFPALVRKRLLETYGSADVFITSLDGHEIKIFPIAEWERVEARLADRSNDDGETSERKNTYAFLANRFGAEQSLDSQGRVLVPGRLREASGHKSKLAMYWQANHIVAMSEELCARREIEHTLSDEDRADAARYGF